MTDIEHKPVELPPLVHGNEAHNPDFLYLYYLAASSLQSTPINITTTPSTILTLSSSLNAYHIPFFGLEYQADPANTIDNDLQLWLEVPLGTVKSATIIAVAKLLDSYRPIFLSIACRDVFDNLFWRTRFSSAWAIVLRAKSSGEIIQVRNRYGYTMRVT